MKLDEYQTKGLTEKAFHKLLISGDLFPAVGGCLVVRRKKEKRQLGCRSLGKTQDFLVVFIA